MQFVGEEAVVWEGIPEKRGNEKGFSFQRVCPLPYGRGSEQDPYALNTYENPYLVRRPPRRLDPRRGLGYTSPRGRFPAIRSPATAGTEGASSHLRS